MRFRRLISKKRNYRPRRRSIYKRKLAFGKGLVRGTRRVRRFGRMLSRFSESKVKTDVFNNSVQTSGLSISIPSITQGTGRTQRVGNKIFIRYMKIKGYINENKSNTGLIRMALVWPRRIDVAIGDFPTSSYTQPFDLDKFTIIWDKYVPLASAYNLGTGAGVENQGTLSVRPVTVTVPIMKSYVYDDNANYPQQPLPFLFLWSADSIAPSPFFDASTTVTFTDN